MTLLARDLGLWFWRLVPANPILVRVVFAASRRLRHFWIRLGYLVILGFIVMAGVLGTQSQGASSLADLAKSATSVFKSVAYLQLVMVCLLAPIFAAAAITQEKDSNTFAILLTTPLSNAQIVFGSLLSRLYFVFVLVLAGLPLICLLMIYGGVTFSEIGMSAGLAATSAFIAGSLAIAISVIRVGTRKTIMSFYFSVFFYLAGLYALSRIGGLIPDESQTAPGGEDRMSWLAAFHPFLSLKVALSETPAPTLAAVMHYGWPWNYLLAYPAQCYMLMTTVAAMGMLLASLSFVRASANEGHPTFFNRLFSRKKDTEVTGDDRSRRARNVWGGATGRFGVMFGPVGWREAMTRAAGGGRAVQRVIVIVIGVMAAAVLLYFYTTGLPMAMTRLWLESIIAIELGLALLVATNTAATGLTREKEAGTLDILLLTPLESKDVLAGKVTGLVVFTLPMLLIPWLSMLLFVFYDLIKGRFWSVGGPGAVINPELLLTMPILMISFAAAACMNGLHQSIRCRKTVQAVVYGVGIFLGVVGILSACIQIGQNSWMLGAVLMPLGPIGAVMVAINPKECLEPGALAAGDVLSNVRLMSSIAALVSAAIWAGVGKMLYSSMVRSFDMVIRKQTT